MKTIIAHIEELRKRLIQVLLIFLVFSVASLFFQEKILDIFSRLTTEQLAVLTPTEGFVVAIKLSLLAGFVLTSPFLFFHLWRFLSAGLKKKEKNKILYYLPLSIILFVSGLALAYFVVIPLISSSTS